MVNLLNFLEQFDDTISIRCNRGVCYITINAFSIRKIQVTQSFIRKPLVTCSRSALLLSAICRIQF